MCAENWAHSHAFPHPCGMLIVAIGIVMALVAFDVRELLNRPRPASENPSRG